MHNGAKKVQPQFIVKKNKTTGVLISAAVIGGVGYLVSGELSKTKNGQPAPQADIDKARIRGLASGAGMTILWWGLYAGNFKTKKKTIDVPNSQFDQWLNKYNRKENITYSKYGQDSYSYLIIPKNNINAYETEEKRIKDEVERQRVLAEQRRKAQEEQDRIAREERERIERIEKETRLARETKEREKNDRKLRVYAELVKKNPERLDWKPLIDFGEDVLFPSYILSRMDSRLIKEVGCTDENFHSQNDCRSVLGISVVSPSPDFEITLSIHDADNAFIEPVKRTYKLAEAGKRYVLYPTIAWKTEQLRNQEQENSLSIIYEIGIPDKDVYTKQVKAVRVKSIFDCIFGYSTNDSFKSYKYMFAAYVNEKDPIIEQITDEALKMRIVKSFSGYQEDKQQVIDQVRAIWTVLQSRGVKYSSLTGSDYSKLGVISQPVMPLSKVYKNSQANCVDGTVAFASILKKIGIDPLIVILPGHAFLGFCTKPYSKDTDWQDRSPVFIETTLIGSRNIVNFERDEKVDMAQFVFDKAMASGNATFYDKVFPNLKQEKAYSVIDVTFYREIIGPIGK